MELVRLVLPVLRRPKISAADFEAVAQEVPQVLGIVLGFNCLGCGWPAWPSRVFGHGFWRICVWVVGHGLLAVRIYFWGGICSFLGVKQTAETSRI